MAKVRENVQNATSAGISPVYRTGTNVKVGTADQYLVNNDGRVLLHVKKTGAGDCTVTVVTPETVDGLAVADRTFTVVATSGDVMAGPFSPEVYNKGQDMEVSFSNVAGLSFAAIRV